MHNQNLGALKFIFLFLLYVYKHQHADNKIKNYNQTSDHQCVSVCV